MNELLLAIFQIIASLGGLACYVLVVYTMFQNEDSTLGIVCVALLLCSVGYVIAFVMGWVKSADYGIGKIMIAWTVLIAVSGSLAALSVAN